jgi:hypothetical protein
VLSFLIEPAIAIFEARLLSGFRAIFQRFSGWLAFDSFRHWHYIDAIDISMPLTYIILGLFHAWYIIAIHYAHYQLSLIPLISFHYLASLSL